MKINDKLIKNQKSFEHVRFDNMINLIMRMKGRMNYNVIINFLLHVKNFFDDNLVISLKTETSVAQ